MKVPKTLLNDLRSLADRFENVIRADERKRLLAKFRAETGRKPVAKPEPLYPVTGLHGEPLNETPPARVKTVAHNVGGFGGGQFGFDCALHWFGSFSKGSRLPDLDRPGL